MSPTSLFKYLYKRMRTIRNSLINRRRIGIIESLEGRRTLSYSTSVADINPLGSSSPADSFNSSIGIFFSAAAPDTGRELYVTNGTVAGTRLVRDLSPGTDSSFPSFFVEMDGIVYFRAFTNAFGSELWRTDGTQFGTYMVADLNPGAPGGVSGAMAVVDGTLFLAADSGGTGFELWKSDGTAAGTTLVNEIVPGTVGSDPNSMLSYNGVLLFSAYSVQNGRELWRSDGTALGTFEIADVNPGPVGSDLTGLTLSGTNAYFRAFTVANGVELYRTNGTGTGTAMVLDIFPGLGNSVPNFLGDVGGVLYFSATDGATGVELWRTTGTAASTQLVADINPGSGGSDPDYLRPATGSKFYFAATRPADGRELWTSNGTLATTLPVSDTWPGTASSNPVPFAVINSILYFAAQSPSTGYEVYQTLGTLATTSLFVDLIPGSVSSFPYGPQVVGETLMIGAFDSALGSEPTFINTRPTVMIDNNRPGYTETGVWAYSVVKGVNNSTSRFSNQLTATASWSAQSLTLGYYKVELYKIVVPNSSAAVDIRVIHADGSKTLRTSYASGGPSGWSDLGIYRLGASSTHRVTISNVATTGVLRADAVRFTPVATPVVLDFGGPGYIEVGTWTTSTLRGNANTTTRQSSSVGASVTYSPVLISSSYTVQIYLVTNADSTTNAEVTIASNSGFSTYQFNQSASVSGWVTLGTFNFDGVGDEYVRLRNLSSGVLRADAVRFFKR